MYSRYISVAIIALLVALTVACAGPEAEKAIFVARETTAVKAEQTDRKVAAPATSELKPSDQQTDATPTTDVSTPSVTTTTLELRPWTLLAGGDVLLDRTEPEGIDPFLKVEPDLASAEVAIVNLEMAITERGEPYDKEFVFRAPGSAALTLAGAGIDVVSLANNHILDYGSIGLADTISVLDEVGILRPGAGSNLSLIHI